jgi:hypothetical protein
MSSESEKVLYSWKVVGPEEPTAATWWV